MAYRSVNIVNVTGEWDTQPTTDNCPFCDIWREDAPAEWVLRSSENEHVDVAGIVPLNPVTPGHVIFFPSTHVIDALMQPTITGAVFEVAARYAEMELERGEGCNLITSVGEYATQTVLHLHVHVVPRRKDDGLKLPWSDQIR